MATPWSSHTSTRSGGAAGSQERDVDSVTLTGCGLDRRTRMMGA
jgi:hypothetical protein